MEIKTEHDIFWNYDSNTHKNKNKKWISVESLQNLNKIANLRWCAEVLEKEIEKYHEPATNMRGIARHLVYQLGVLESYIYEKELKGEKE